MFHPFACRCSKNLVFRSLRPVQQRNPSLRWGCVACASVVDVANHCSDYVCAEGVAVPSVGVSYSCCLLLCSQCSAIPAASIDCSIQHRKLLLIHLEYFYLEVLGLHKVMCRCAEPWSGLLLRVHAVLLASVRGPFFLLRCEQLYRAPAVILFMSACSTTTFICRNVKQNPGCR